MGISVVICCYNSANRLPETLRHLALQEVPDGLEWEVILVNNASEDDTSRIAREIWQVYCVIGCSFSILDEPKPGKNYAFEKGVRAARYDYILTCDDDNWLAPNYVSLACAIMNNNPKIGALGGYGEFEPEQPLTQEIQDYTSYFVSGPQTSAKTNHWVYGAGSVYRRKAFIDLVDSGWQQITTGRKGKSLICGEDVEICMMLYLTGYQIETSDQLKFRHFVPHSRQKLSYILNLGFWLSYSDVLLINYHLFVASDAREIEQIVNGWLVNLTRSVIKNCLSSLYRKLRTGKPRNMNERIAFNSVYGRFRALLENRSRIVRHYHKTRELLESPEHSTDKNGQ